MEDGGGLFAASNPFGFRKQAPPEIRQVELPRPSFEMRDIEARALHLEDCVR
jgi:hypothetical protein